MGPILLVACIGFGLRLIQRDARVLRLIKIAEITRHTSDIRADLAYPSTGSKWREASYFGAVSWCAW